MYSILDVALVAAPQDLEESVVTPVCLPGVGNEPIHCINVHYPLLLSPADDFDRMPSRPRLTVALVNTRLVADKVRHQVEVCFRTILVHVFRDLLHRVEGVGVRAQHLVILIRLAVRGDTLSCAGRSGIQGCVTPFGTIFRSAPWATKTTRSQTKKKSPARVIL